MRNPFIGNKGKALAAGMIAAVFSLAVMAAPPAVAQAWQSFMGVVVLAAFISLFIPKYHYLARSFLVGSMGLLLFIGTIAISLALIFSAIK